jgi:Tfp pilus assembly protein PilE
MKLIRYQGVGLLELMLAIAVSAMIIILSTLYYQSTAQSQNIALANNVFRDVYKATARYFQQNKPKDIDSKTLIKAGLLSNRYETNPWGGTIKITIPEAVNGFFVTISMDKIPTSACTQLGEQLKTTLTVSEKIDDTTCKDETLAATYELQ